MLKIQRLCILFSLAFLILWVVNLRLNTTVVGVFNFSDYAFLLAFDMIPVVVDFIVDVIAVINTTTIFAATIDTSIAAIIVGGTMAAAFVVVFVVAHYNSTSFYSNA